MGLVKVLGKDSFESKTSQEQLDILESIFKSIQKESITLMATLRQFNQVPNHEALPTYLVMINEKIIDHINRLIKNQASFLEIEVAKSPNNGIREENVEILNTLIDHLKRESKE